MADEVVPSLHAARGWVLCVDAGQTGTRAQLRRDGVPTGVSEHPGVLNDRELAPQLAASIRAALREAGTECPLVAIGSSGLKDDADPTDLLNLLDGTGVRTVLLAHDSTTSYLSAVGDTRGAVVASGTGVVTLAVGRTAVARVDGWGYLIGDAGSGYWIGRAALDAVMRAHDGRGRRTALSEHIERDFDNIEEAYLELQADEQKVSRIASYAKTVAALASSDATARAISENAATELAHSILTGLDRVGESSRPDPTVGLVGKVFRNTVLHEHFEKLIAASFPQVHLTEGHGDGLEGCYALTQLAPDSALHQRVASASAGGQ
ncbi:BadF-type ATPase [Propionibacterium cyclohexanicum]|uniref:BadF-type ATPase n=1 Tax=Propionibacterium cyclohexanicum TaxID=64702 RepID=A0A1H9T948_9ACTN|nr:BadF/BadG/BcrA/BcrD ATPase family protein [Propionibacterium cyclohexanicum]SER93319.1 BadF-type ATPase [Propionibacterium cyclohexanicum]